MSDIKKIKFFSFDKSNTNINKDNKKMNQINPGTTAKISEFFNNKVAPPPATVSSSFATPNKEQARVLEFIKNINCIEEFLQSGDVDILKGLVPADKLTEIYALITSYRNSHH